MKRKSIATKKKKDNEAGTSNRIGGELLTEVNVETAANTEKEPIDENESTPDTDGPPKKKKRFSPVWQHFSIKSENNNEVAHCKYCEK